MSGSPTTQNPDVKVGQVWKHIEHDIVRRLQIHRIDGDGRVIVTNLETDRNTRIRIDRFRGAGGFELESKPT